MDSHQKNNDSSLFKQCTLKNIVHNHLVHFYEEEENLFKNITSFALRTLNTSDAVVIVAVKSRLDRLENFLKAQQVNIDFKKKTQQIVFLDADTTLNDLMPFGFIDQAIFKNMVDELLSSLTQKYTNVFLYGEMVNLLAEKGDLSSCLALEGMWNGFMQKYRFTILCGYSIYTFKEDQPTDFHAICAAHSQVHSENTTMLKELYKTVDGPKTTLEVSSAKRIAELEEELSRRKTTETTLLESISRLSRRADTALQHERDAYRTLLSILPVGVYGTTRGSTEAEDVFVNKRFSEISGLSVDEIKKQGFMHAVHPEDRENVQRHWDVVRDKDTSHSRIEYRFVHSDGSIVWASGETAVKPTLNGLLAGCVHSVIDITEIKRLEIENRLVQQESEEHQRRRLLEAENNRKQQEEFVDSLCHELRNPLGGIYGNVELLYLGLEARTKMLEQAQLDKKVEQKIKKQIQLDAESLAAIATCVTHQKVITDDVLNLSKLDLGKVVLQKVPFLPSMIISNVSKMFTVQAERKGLSLQTKLPLVDVGISGDPDRLSQILVNLVTNAVKFTEQGHISLELEVLDEKEGYVTLQVTVEDTGVGMAPEVQEILFRRFSRPPTSNFQDYEGSGLGLFLSKGLVELMGGTISVESEKGKGSKFFFTFTCESSKCPSTCEDTFASRYFDSLSLYPPPSVSEILKDISISPHTNLKSSRYEACSRDSNPPKPLPPDLFNILVVEDNDLNRRVVKRLIQVKGYRCIEACNGLEAINAFKNCKVDLIIMDIQMPVMDGITSTLRIREINNQVPIVGLSGNAREAHMVKALESGMNKYLTKPIKKEDLYAVIEGFRWPQSTLN
jgi:PAS domain S-box-containing protein